MAKIIFVVSKHLSIFICSSGQENDYLVWKEQKKFARSFIFWNHAQKGIKTMEKYKMDSTKGKNSEELSLLHS